MYDELKPFLVIALAFLNFSCHQQTEKPEDNIKTKTVKPDMHTNKISLDWEGTYFGVVPCADCQGIETLLTIKDSTFRLVTKYLGKSDYENIIKGTFYWNDEENKITLSGNTSRPNHYFVAENKLIQLDLGGNKITGELAERYVLNKSDRVSLMDTKWKLIEFRGKPVEYKAPESNEVYIQFNSEDKKVFGFSGCNTFRGGFELNDRNRISFSQLASTMMACPDIELETEFIKAIQSADNYNFDGKQFVLNRSRMAPLARFEAMNE